MTLRIRSVLLMLMILAIGQSAEGGDWPQILGPSRNSQSNDEGQWAGSWPSAGPNIAWKFAASAGYAGASIVGDRAYLFDRSEASERLTAVDLDSGKQVWQASWNASYRSSMNPDSGPRCVPCIQSGVAVCYGAAGDLVCVEIATGKIRWNRPIRKETKADDGYFGAGSSPMIVGNTVIANIGGKKAGIVGVGLADGKTLWTATDYDSSYASPVGIGVGGKPAALVVTRLKTVLIDVANGEVLSEVNFGQRGPTVNAATPLPVGDNQFFLTASYGIGAMLIGIEDGALKRLWTDPELLASQYNSPLWIGGKVLGCDGREDMGPAALKAIDLQSKSVLWSQPMPGPTHAIALRDRVLLVSVSGSLKLMEFEPSAYKELASVSLPEGVYRSLPAYANHKLILRRTLGPTRSEFFALTIP